MTDASNIKGRNLTFTVGGRKIRAFIPEDDARALDELGKSLSVSDQSPADDVVVMGGSILIQCPKPPPSVKFKE